MVFCVGLTGSIASGKTTVAQCFASLGVAVISADQVARALRAKGQPAYAAIVDHFGQQLVLPDGELDRNRLRDIIFNNPEERAWLEALLHPLIRDRIKDQAISSTQAYCLIEIPLLVDKTTYPYLDRILVVTAEEELQIARVMLRDTSSREQALAILEVQPPLATRLDYADDVIVNDAGIDELQHQVLALHEKYLTLA